MSSASAPLLKVCDRCHEGALGSLTRCPRCGADLGQDAARSNDRLAGMTLNQQYRLLAFVDEGGMGLVYRGERVSPAHVVAVKLLKLERESDRYHAQRFLREANASRLLRHPHVVTVIDAGTTAGELPFIVAEFLGGTTLAHVMERQGQLPLERALNIFNQLLAGVEAAHRAGVIHRDLKPENVMLLGADGGRDFVKVIDFGIAEIKGQQQTRLTRQGEIVGTPAYMSPEQIQGRVVSEEGDIYALGVILFEMLTAARPFQGQSLAETLSGHLFQQPPSVLELSRHVGLPRELEAVVRKTLAKEPQQRHRTVGELRRHLFGAFAEQGHEMLACRACHRSADCLPWDNGDGALAPADPCFLELVPVDARAPTRVAPGADLQATRSLRRRRRESSREPTRGLPAALDLAPAPSGRQLEVEVIGELLGDGGPRVLQLVAPAGAGKSTLLDWARAAATSGGVTVHRCGPDPTLAGAPWYPFRRLLSRLLDLPAEAPDPGLLARRVLEAGLTAGDLSGIVDLLGLPRAGGLPEPGVRLSELTCATVRLLTRGASPLVRQPTLLLFDDVQAYDRGSAHLLQALAAAVAAGAPAPVRVLMASDAALMGIAVGEPLVPAALPPEEVRGSLERRLGEAAARLPLDEAFVRRAGSDLLLLDQAIRHLQQGGPAAALEGDLEALVQKRLEGLSAERRALLEALAGLGLAAPVDLLGEALARSGQPRDVAPGLAADGWLAEDGPELAFSHPTLARMVHDAMVPEKRQQLHRRLLELLRARGASPLVLARHAFEAHLLPDALELNEQAGDLARAWLDSDSAGVTFYYRAAQVARWEAADELDEEPLLTTLLKRVAAEHEVGHHLAAGEGLREARALREWKRPRSEAALLAWEGRLQAGAGAGGGDGGVALLEQSLELAGACDDGELARQVLQDLARALVAAQQADRALELVAGWIADGRPGAGQWSLQLLLSTLCQQAGAQDRALEAAREAARLARQQRSRPGVARSAQRLGALLLRARDDPEAAAEELLRAAGLLSQLGDRKGAARCLLLHASALPGAGTASAARALELSLQLGWEEGAERACLLLGGCDRQGQPARPNNVG
jgi:hypothetical protein